MIKQKKTKQTYIRHSITEDLSILNSATDKPQNRKHKIKIEINGQMINMSSLRLLTFKEKGVDCVTCSTKGKFLALEKHRSSTVYHINLYGIYSDGEEVLMTKDHILAKSNGGEDTLENMQPMCSKCNLEKGNNPN
tara:strand:- start:5089 stop:5496 length:408 start_codon:yes stop_codon:yes gene_type:complete